jgi:hypothetical protein
LLTFSWSRLLGALIRRINDIVMFNIRRMDFFANNFGQVKGEAVGQRIK